MKTQCYTTTSLDGFIATEDDSLDWLFQLGDVNETSYPTWRRHSLRLRRRATGARLRLVLATQIGTGFVELRYDVPRSATEHE